MEQARTFVMLDPATDQVLAECSGATADGRCPLEDQPPYVCAGLHLVSAGETPAQDVSFTVTEMKAGECPLAFVNASPEAR